MKKSKLLILIPTLFILAGCGNNSTSGNTDTVEPTPEGYKVTVLLPDGSPAKKVKVRWCDDSTCQMTTANDNGVSYFKGKDGVTYDVHLTLTGEYYDLYAYNPNIYHVSEEQQEITIKLSNLKTPVSGNGNKYDAPYRIEEGYYRAEVNEYKTENDYVFYSFVPNRPGVYKVESLIEATDFVDPFIAGFGNTSAYLFHSEGNDDNDSGFDRNFLYEFEVLEDAFSVDEEGKSYCMAQYNFGLTSLVNEGTYDFNLSYSRPLDDVEEVTRTMVQPTSTLTQYDDSEYELAYFDLSEHDIAVFNENDGTYHYGSVDGKQILCNIAGNGYYVPGGLYTIFLNQGLVTAQGTKDYAEFIEAYYNVCNEDGVYPLTEELKVLLEEIAEKEMYFKAGGWIASDPAFTDFTFGEQAKFLYGCSYYTNVIKTPEEPSEEIVE